MMTFFDCSATQSLIEVTQMTMSLMIWSDHNIQLGTSSIVDHRFVSSWA